MGKIRFGNKNFLNFLYALTQVEQNLSFRGMSKLPLECGKSISEPTVKKWFQELIGDKDFYYYPTTRYEVFSLCSLSLLYPSIHGGPLAEKEDFFKKIDSFKLLNVKTLEPYILEHFLVPKEKVPLFKEVVAHAFQKVQIFETKSEHVFYNPFHKVFDKDGCFQVDQGTFPDQEISRLQAYLSEEVEPLSHDFLKYIFLERIGNTYNSYALWNILKNKIDVWRYMPRRQRSDSVGIKHVQETLRMQSPPVRHKLFFPPLYNGLRAVVIVAPLDNKRIVELSQRMAPNSLSLSLFKGGTTLLCAYTNIQGFYSALDFFKDGKDPKTSLFIARGKPLPA